jgi:hypothetical protein
MASLPARCVGQFQRVARSGPKLLPRTPRLLARGRVWVGFRRISQHTRPSATMVLKLSDHHPDSDMLRFGHGWSQFRAANGHRKEVQPCPAHAWPTDGLLVILWFSQSCIAVLPPQTLHG